MEGVLNKIVEFKGTQDGIILQIRAFDHFDEVADCIHQKLEKSAQFFTGATIIGVEGLIGEEINRYRLYKILTEDYQLKVTSLNQITKLVKEPEIVEVIEEVKEEEPTIQVLDYNEYDTKIVRKNLRSGMSVSYDGNILVIGDVNPGAEISAGGNVIVMGKLRGMVHAGKFGNKEVYIIASKLIPTQIRVANIIARAPEDDNIDELKPEIAHIVSGHMSIEEL
jgi:septum site-determining protein MinC